MNCFVAMHELAACAASALTACPLCDSDTAETTRAGIFDERLLANLAALLAPFAAVGALAAVIQADWSGLLGRGRRPRRGAAKFASEERVPPPAPARATTPARSSA